MWPYEPRVHGLCVSDWPGSPRMSSGRWRTLQPLSCGHVGQANTFNGGSIIHTSAPHILQSCGGDMQGGQLVPLDARYSPRSREAASRGLAPSLFGSGTQALAGAASLCSDLHTPALAQAIITNRSSVMFGQTSGLTRGKTMIVAVCAIFETKSCEIVAINLDWFTVKTFILVCLSHLGC